MDRVSAERQKNLEIAHSKLQDEKVNQRAVETFKRKPYETLAEYAERQVRENNPCNGCFGAANGDCGECDRRVKK